MKRLVHTLVFTLLLASVAVAHAQTTVNALSDLLVELWPDYDRPSVLVLLTGTLPPEATLPATVTLPLPPDANLNAVAAVDASGNMFDTEFTAESGVLTLTTPDPRFRVEYYVPYRQEGAERSYTFTWEADLDVAQLTLRVQEPTAATELDLTPAAARITSDRGDGLTYHILPAQPVPVGQPFTATLTYTLAGDMLTAPPGAPSPLDTVAETAVAADAAPLDWTLILVGVAGVLLSGALIWSAWSQWGGNGRKRRRARKPSPQRPTSNRTQSGATAKFCHNCGQPTQPGDSFCRNCGTPLKNN